MTIDEAKILLCQMYLPQFDEEEKQALTIAIQALEEIQQYRSIGTVEELVKTQIREKVLNVELESYKEIGTIEAFKALKENQRKCEDCAGCTNWKCDCANIREQAITEFYDKVLNFEDYIEPKGTSEFGAVLLYSGKDITNMIVKIADEMRGAE